MEECVSAEFAFPYDKSNVAGMSPSTNPGMSPRASPGRSPFRTPKWMLKSKSTRSMTSSENSSEKRKTKTASQIFLTYIKLLSPVSFVRRARDYYVSALNNCSQRCVYQGYGVGVGGISKRAMKPLSSGMERCRSLESLGLSRGDWKAFNEMYGSPSMSPYMDSDKLLYTSAEGYTCPFRRSFSEYESCLSPKMRKTYIEAATYSPRSMPPRSSLSSYREGMIIFPIDEIPEPKGSIDLPLEV